MTQRKLYEKHLAYRLVHGAVKAGTLARPDRCSSCKKECTAVAHHADYARPLDVVWLCHKCHSGIHKHLFVRLPYGIDRTQLVTAGPAQDYDVVPTHVEDETPAASPKQGRPVGPGSAKYPEVIPLFTAPAGSRGKLAAAALAAGVSRAEYLRRALGLE